MPGTGPQNTRKRQIRRKKPTPKVKPPTSRQVSQAKQQAQTYVSQGKAVEKVAGEQKAKAKRQRAAAPYVSQGKAVEKVADKQVAATRAANPKRIHLRKAVKRELEGKGLLAKTLHNIAKNAGYVSTGGGPNVGVAAGRKAKTGSFAPRGSAAITAPRVVSGKEAKIAGRFAQDFVNFPAQAIPSVYVPAAAAVEAVRGHPQRGKQFIKDVKKSDPVYNAGAAVVEKVKGNDKAAAAHLRRAGKAASEHPGFTALEAYGLKGTIGRGIGRVVKAPERPSATVEGTTLEEKRTYSPDAIRRQREKATDKVKTKRAVRLRAKADHATTDDDALELRRKANRVDPTKMTATQVRRRVDDSVAATEDVRRINRSQITRDVDEAVKPAKKGGAALSLVAQRITKADKADLAAYRDEIAAHFDDLPKSGKRANRQLRKSIDDVLKDPKADMGKVHAAARRYEEITAPLQKKLSERGLLAEGQADKAKLIPYAVRHMGAHHDAKPRPVDAMAERHEQAKDLASDAHDQAVTARADLRKAQSVAGKASGLRRNGTPKRTVEINLPTPRAKGTFKLPARALNERERAVVDARLAEFQKATRENIKVKRTALKESVREEGKAATQAKRATPKKYVPGIVDEHGDPLTADQIREHMKAHGVDEPAFLTQAPNTRGARNFYVASNKAPQLRVARRTGEATRKGTFDAHPDTLRENAARAQGLADATDGFTNFIHEFGHREGGKLITKPTRKEIEKVAADRQANDKGGPTGDLELRPVRINPWGGSHAQLERLLDEVDSDSPTAHKAVADVIADAVKEDAGGDGPWALVPKAAADQLAKHMRVTGPGALGKGAQLVNSSFRKTVLATSPAWLVGNVAEAAGRAAIAKAGPRSLITGKKVIRELERQDPEAAKEFTVRSAGGGHYSMADRQPRRDHTQFEDTKIEGLARKAGAFWRSPGPKQAAGAWHAWTDLVFNQINRRIESTFQTAMLGKAIRDSNLMDGQTLKTGQKAVEQAARGLKNTNEQVAFGRAVDRMYGKYNKFSPEGRQALALYTPFIAWTLNAVRFVYDVLPRDHPTVTALIAASELATDDWRKSEGLDLFIDQRVPSFLQGSIPTKGGGKFRASRYTPFGAFGSPIETATGAVLPQLSGVLAAGRGEDWKGAKLRVNGKEANELQRWGFAAKAFAEATVPILSVGERVAQGGPAALNPVKTVAPKKKIRRSAGAPKWNGGGGVPKWDG